MSAILITGIAVLVLVVIGLGYMWIVREPRSAAYGAYQDQSRGADTTHHINFTADHAISMPTAGGASHRQD